MTNKEALKAAVSLPCEDIMLDKALIDHDLNAGQDYTKANKATINQAAMQVLQGLKSTKSVTVGDFAYTVDANAVSERLLELSGVYIETKKPTITGIRPW